MVKILFFGDVYGKLGRLGLVRVLPVWKEEYKPDFVIVNVENLAHGKGITPATMAELDSLGIDIYTSGNHVLAPGQPAAGELATRDNLIRPHNYGPDFPGKGWCQVSKNGATVVTVNLNGTVFFENQFRGTITSPFFALDEVLTAPLPAGAIIVVDFHAEATSEKVALGWHADGRVSAVLGTHTHVPTADNRILPAGTAYVTDVGMTGSYSSVIGVEIEGALNRFLTGDKGKVEPSSQGPVVVNAMLMTFEGIRARSIERLQKVIEIS
jgi:metallophosphoesterase (TIGR00282 family)